MIEWNPAPGVRGHILYGSVDGPLLIGRVELIKPSPLAWPLEPALPPIVVPPRTPHTVRNPSKTETATLLAILRRTVT